MTRKTDGKIGIAAGCVLAVCLISIVLLTGVSQGTGQPKIKFQQETWDFGRAKEGDVLTCEFVFLNEGDAPLVINKVDTSCGCAAALVTEKRINPGKEGRIKVTFNTRGYSGRVSKYVFVESNDPSNPRRQLTISADIDVPPQPRIDLDRYNVDIGLLLQGEEIQTKVRIANKGELELKVEGTHREASFFSGGKPIPFPLSIPAGRQAELEIRIPSEKRAGVLREYVLIKSNDPLRANLSVYLSGYVVTRDQLRNLFNRYKAILEK